MERATCFLSYHPLIGINGGCCRPSCEGRLFGSILHDCRLQIQVIARMETVCQPQMPQSTTMSRKPIQFNKSWIVKFGLEVSTRDVATSQGTSVLCLFCKHHDDTDADERKRKRTTTTSSATRRRPFHRHLKTQHRSKWEIYQGLSAEEQIIFFLSCSLKHK